MNRKDIILASAIVFLLCAIALSVKLYRVTEERRIERESKELRILTDSLLKQNDRIFQERIKKRK